jgi:hypothetical protein
MPSIINQNEKKTCCSIDLSNSQILGKAFIEQNKENLSTCFKIGSPFVHLLTVKQEKGVDNKSIYNCN